MLMNIKVEKYKQILLDSGIGTETLKGSYIAGGAIRDIIQGVEPKDVDIFFIEKKYYDLFMEELIQSKIFSVTTENSSIVKLQNIEFNMNKCSFGNPLDVIKEFDFTVNMNFVKFDNSNIFHVRDLPSVLNRTLRINPSARNKIGTLLRIEKFINKGYTYPPKMDITRIAVQISQMEPINKFSELEESSRTYFSGEEYADVDYLDKDEKSVHRNRFRGSGL